MRQVLAVLNQPATLALAAVTGPRRKPPTSEEPAATLTNRKIDVLALLAQRMSDKEIAERLVLSPETVKKHTASIYRKLGVHGAAARFRLASWAWSDRLTSKQKLPSIGQSTPKLPPFGYCPSPPRVDTIDKSSLISSEIPSTEDSPFG